MLLQGDETVSKRERKTEREIGGMEKVVGGGGDYSIASVVSQKSYFRHVLS